MQRKRGEENVASRCLISNHEQHCRHGEKASAFELGDYRHDGIEMVRFEICFENSTDDLAPAIFWVQKQVWVEKQDGTKKEAFHSKNGSQVKSRSQDKHRNREL